MSKTVNYCTEPKKASTAIPQQNTLEKVKLSKQSNSLVDLCTTPTKQTISLMYHTRKRFGSREEYVVSGFFVLSL